MLFFVIVLYSILLNKVLSGCSSGYFSLGDSCQVCPDGHYCPPNGQPIPCPIGTVSYSTISYRTNCAACSNGYYMDETGKTDCKKCPNGHFCPSKTEAVQCPKGFSSFDTQSYRTSCARCSSGYYADSEGSSDCKVCPIGHYCPSSDVVLPCPIGTASYDDIQYRTACWKCANGYYQDLEGQSSCKVCPQGFFCPTSDMKVPCPAGTISYSDISYRTSCAKCSNGYYNELEGEVSCKKCPDGYFCPTTDAQPIPCPAGTISFSDISYRTSCFQCSAGYYNELEGQTVCKKCPIGYYCDVPSACPKQCPAGTTSSAGSTGINNCYKCDSCSVSPISCSNSITPSYSIFCQSGYLEFNSQCKLCNDGHYCPSPYLTAIICPKGTINFRIDIHRVDCLRCSYGYYNDVVGGINNAIYSDCKLCPVGHFCPSPYHLPYKCPSGTVNYLDSHLRTSCQKCPIGYFNNKHGGVRNSTYSDCIACPAGFFCSDVSSCPTRCPDGTTSNKESWSVKNCVPCTNCMSTSIECETGPTTTTSTSTFTSTTSAVIEEPGYTCPDAVNEPNTQSGCYYPPDKPSCECATGVQVVCKYKLNLTKCWIKGRSIFELCQSGKDLVAPYTPIATFYGNENDPDGPYNYKPARHAAIFLECLENNSIKVYDQYNSTTIKPWSTRIIKDKSSTVPDINDSRAFYVIKVKDNC